MLEQLWYCIFHTFCQTLDDLPDYDSDCDNYHPVKYQL